MAEFKDQLRIFEGVGEELKMRPTAEVEESGDPNFDIAPTKNDTEGTSLNDGLIEDALHEVERAAEQKILKCEPVRIGQGDDNEVYDLGNGRVVKTQPQSSEFTLSWIAENREKYKILQKYLGNFLPETQYFESLPDEVGESLTGKPGLIQEKINGVPLDNVTEETYDDPVFLAELIEMMKQVLEIYKNEDELVDWSGSAPDGRVHSIANPLGSKNVYVGKKDGDKKQLYLVDTNFVPDTKIEIERKGKTHRMRVTLARVILFMPLALFAGKIKEYFNIRWVEYVAKVRQTRLTTAAQFKIAFPLIIRSLENKMSKLQENKQ